MNNSLFHWGIPGMKWGVRRANRRAAALARQSEDHKTVAGLRKKKVSEMSNDELKKLTTRLQLEKQLKDLSIKDVSSGRKFLNEVLSTTGRTLVSKFLVDTVNNNMAALVKYALKYKRLPTDKEVESYVDWLKKG